MWRAATRFSGLKLKAWWCAPCSEPVGVLLAVGWPRELWKDQKSKEMCPPGSWETQQPWGVQAASGTVSEDKFQNFFCSCKVKTERTINADQIKGEKNLTKDHNSFW